MSRLVLGSRGSKLALAQVELARQSLLRAHPNLEIEVKVITTSGDRRQDAMAGEGSAAGLKGLFTKEIQEALMEASIDAAVHSIKDLPGAVPAALCIAAVLPRADTSDLLISGACASLAALPGGARVGTSSVRRRRQLLWLSPRLEVIELRGNVPTRLQKLTALSLDAIVLARAGLDRLGYSLSGGRLECDAGSFHAAPLAMLAAIGQGAIGLEARREDSATLGILSAIDDLPTHACIRVERELLRLFDGDCTLPIGARATLDDSGALHADAIVFQDDEAAPPARAQAAGPASDPEAVARRLFDRLLGFRAT